MGDDFVPSFGFQQPGAFDVAGTMANNYANSGFGNWQNAATQPYAAPQAQMGGQGGQGGGFGFNTGTIDAIGGVIGGIGSAVGAYTGYQQMKLAKKQLAFQKEVFAKNWANQVATTNMQLRDRQNARRGASSSYQSTDDYMQQNAVK